MKGLVVESAGTPAEVRSDLKIPEPNDHQILVKSIYTAVNPVDAFMADWGTLVLGWPLVPGCETGGVVVKAGKNALSPLGVPFKEGDEVCGCTRLGTEGFSPWQEYFLMDSEVTIPKPNGITLAEAATIGSGTLTAFLGVFRELKIPLVDPSSLPTAKDEWALVFGGAGSVGKFAVQAFKVSGFKVATTCSAKSFDLLKSLGADAIIDYKRSEAEIVDEVKAITGVGLDYMFDAASVNNSLATAISTSLPPSSRRMYTTTNDWDPLPDTSVGFTSYPIKLGPIGRPEAADLNKELNKYIPVIVKLVESRKLRLGEHSVEGKGIEGLLEAWEVQKSGKAGSAKVLVEIASV